MYIKLVELENIKSHAESKFEFAPGSTAITGRNGAGKTTIIEAVAWALFDVLDYKKDDFVKRGTKKGSVRVTFESGADEREYIVYRDTGTGYYVFDPRLKLRIADKKEDVTRFLWQHLGVEPGTDLESLFKHAIGVPQGTFTAIFLATAAERKKTFDTLLKVEEYRRGAEELLKTQRFVEGQKATVRESIARSEGELARLDELRSALEVAEKEAETYAAELSATETAALKLSDVVAQLDARERRTASAKIAFEKASAAHAQAGNVRARAAADLAESKEAMERIDTVRAAADRYIQSIGRLAELERERVERDRIRSEVGKVETALARVNSEETLTRAKLVDAQSAASEIAMLGPRVSEQVKLESQLAELRTELAALHAQQTRREHVAARILELRETYKQFDTDIKEALKLVPLAERLAELTAEEGEVTSKLAGVKARLDRDEQFQRQIKDGLCPILSEKCLNLGEGQTLQSFMTTQFEESRSAISDLEQVSKTLAAELARSREAKMTLARVPQLELRRGELAKEGIRYKAEQEESEKAVERAANVTKEIHRVEAELATLDSPRARLAILERGAVAEIDLRSKLSDIESNLERLESDRRVLNEQMESYRDLDLHWTEATQIRDSTSEAYRTFLVYQIVGANLEARKTDFDNADAAVESARGELEAAEAQFADLTRAYDAESHRMKRDELSAAERRATETAIRVENATRRKRELEIEEQRLRKVRESLQAELRERDRLERVLETTVFIRDTLKEAAPLVARNYVYRVSAEANQLFREVSGDAERTLKWTDDYSVILEEGGYERPFLSLSGGEQMAAALSIRLALLKQLSDIRMAFFDEPTTNMDSERRENLAMQIGQITHFDQLFVISHDDTFEGYMDHEVRVERDER